MDSYNFNGNSNNGPSNKQQPNKSRSNAFSQAAVTKHDVGDFQSGYFVMVDTPSTAHQQQRPKTHKTPERQPTKKGEQTNQQQRPPRTANKDIDQQQHQQREGDMNVSQGRITTSPHRSPTRNKRSPSSQTIPHHQVHSEPTVPSSPHKPRKAHSMDSGSPPKDKPSPSPTNRWAGPAFSNAPPPSSLPLPEFPPFAPSSTTIASPSSSPPQPSPPSMYHENIYIQPPLYAVQQQQAHFQPQFSYQFFYSDVPQASYAEQLSTDLRKMLHIGGPIPA